MFKERLSKGIVERLSPVSVKVTCNDRDPAMAELIQIVDCFLYTLLVKDDRICGPVFGKAFDKYQWYSRLFKRRKPVHIRRLTRTNEPIHLPLFEESGQMLFFGIPLAGI